jgi:tRNA1(Val) A37 N6-methylase TrmN6
VFTEFVRYDFEKAIQLPAEMKQSFDVIICDPPFLSQDCQTKGESKSLKNIFSRY